MTDRKQFNEMGLLSSVDAEMSAPSISPDPLDALETIGQVAGFVFRKAGEDGLRELLTRDTPLDTNARSVISREHVLDAAQELASAGMRRASAIALECAATRPSMTDVEVYCPYPNDHSNRANVRAWAKGEEHRRHEREQQREERFKTKPDKAIKD